MNLGKLERIVANPMKKIEEPNGNRHGIPGRPGKLSEGRKIRTIKDIHQSSGPGIPEQDIRKTWGLGIPVESGLA